MSGEIDQEPSEPESYVEQLEHIRRLASDAGFEWQLDDYAIDALRAVLTHYDAYVAVASAASLYEYCQSSNNERLMAVRTALAAAIDAAQALEHADAQGPTPA